MTKRLQPTLHIQAPAPQKAAMAEAAKALFAFLSPALYHPQGWSANLVLTTNPRVQSLNRIYRGKDKPTNVLSFPTHPADPTLALQPKHPLGDVVLARQVILTEAKTQGKKTRHHLQHLTVHGLLHLMGFDHELSPVEANLMEEIEINILKQLDIPNPYADNA